MSEQQAITGYQLVRNIFKSYSDDPVLKLVRDVAKGETEYLEFKATCVFDKNDPRNKEGETQQDLSWNIARELFALYNTKGGALIIGIDDKTFDAVALPNFTELSQNDYRRTMIRDKIFPKDFRWATKKGSETYTCDERMAAEFLRKALHIEYYSYKGSTVAVLLVEPAPCTDDACIQIGWKKNQDDTYDQLPVRQPGNTGGVENKTQWKDKTAYQKTRRCTDSEYGRIWAQFAPAPDFKSSRSRTNSAQPATAYDSADPESDPLVRALEGRELEFEFAPDTIIDNYRIIRKIGQGGMGIVYEVENISLKEHRAIKVFAPEQPSDLLKRKFLSEARLLARFRHPGLVKVHALGIADKQATLYYEMDLIVSSNGRPMSLGEVYRNIHTTRPPSDTKLREWFAQLCNVLQFLHKKESIVHRDIKLDNILLNTADMAILSDFGIARIKNEQLREELKDRMTMHPTENGEGDANVGTIEYQAPELKNEKASAKSDNYALGVVFFKLLTGHGYTHETGADLQKALKGKSRFWRRVLPKLLAHNPKSRIEDLSRYAICKYYPGMGFRHYLHIIAWFYIASTLVAAIACFCTLQDGGSLIKNSLDFIGKAKQPSVMESSGINSSVQKPLIAPSSAPIDDAETAVSLTEPEPETSVDKTDANEATDYSESELKVAMSDVRALNNYYLSETRQNPWQRRQDRDATADATIESAMDAYHADIFATWQKIKELTKLGMEIQEVLVSRQDLVKDCAHIRREAISQLQTIIDSANYQKALKFYTAINVEFRSCGLTAIPRPSFTPSIK